VDDRCKMVLLESRRVSLLSKIATIGNSCYLHLPYSVMTIPYRLYLRWDAESESTSTSGDDHSAALLLTYSLDGFGSSRFLNSLNSPRTRSRLDST
jgi:hypothetical protein